MIRARRIAGLLGEGAFFGALAGAAAGLWTVVAQADVAHGFRLLALERLARPAVLAALLGVAASIVFALVTAVIRRETRAATWGRRAAVAAAVDLGAACVVPGGRSLWDWASTSTLETDRRAATAVVIVPLLSLGALAALRWLDSKPRGAPSRVSRLYRSTRVVVAASGLVLAGGLGAFLVLLPSIGAARASGRPSVILVSIDTLRADRLGSYGNTRGLTPNLDRIAARSTVFDSAISAAPWTLPSHVSLFTSAMPFDHKVRWSSKRINPRRAMLAERFRDAGYRTAAFTGGGYVAGAFGFDQGFEIYEDVDEQLTSGPQRIADDALSWIHRVRGSPFFLFVHTYEPHSPFEHEGYVSPADRGRLSLPVSNPVIESIHDGQLVLTAPERRYLTDLYDGDVSTADRAIGGLLVQLERDGVLDEAIVIVLSDHGEDLWDHDPVRSPGHGHSLYQELVHVPLFVSLPGRDARGVRVRTPVSLLDVAPTLLDLAGLEPDPRHQGRSLASTCRTAEEPTSVAVRSESVEYGPDRFSEIESGVKVIVTPIPERVHNDVHLVVSPLEVFDLASDPGEHRDLSGSLSPEHRAMARELTIRASERLKGILSEEGKGGKPPEELIPQLKSLGYIR